MIIAQEPIQIPSNDIFKKERCFLVKFVLKCQLIGSEVNGRILPQFGTVSLSTRPKMSVSHRLFSQIPGRLLLFLLWKMTEK